MNLFIGFIGFLISILSISGITGLYIYLSKYYTIKKVKDLELQLSKLNDITDEERILLTSIRGFLEDPKPTIQEKNEEKFEELIKRD